jgi:hypothetical protein
VPANPFIKAFFLAEKNGPLDDIKVLANGLKRPNEYRAGVSLSILCCV